MQRRAFLAQSLAIPALSALGPLQAQEPAASLVIRQKEPENLEMPFATASEQVITPNDAFYIRSHFAVPSVDAAGWKLQVQGAIANPLSLTLRDLQAFPRRNVTATLECAGNSRVYLTPAAAGVQWEQGAVSNAVWTGVPLSAVLERAGLTANALEVLFEGEDSGEIRVDPHPTGTVHYARSLPLQKARQPEVLLAYQMNGQPLPLSHGAPLRLIVPGWYGMASVKWLRRIEVTTEPFMGFYQTVDYAYWDRRNGQPVRRPLQAMVVKSLIARPSLREVVKPGSSYRVRGSAWTGEAEIQQVEVSVDGGKTWSAAKLLDRPTRFQWCRWEFPWTPAQPGSYTLLSRATDSKGQVQPDKHNSDTANYAIHHTLPVRVEVRG